MFRQIESLNDSEFLLSRDVLSAFQEQTETTTRGIAEAICTREGSRYIILEGCEVGEDKQIGPGTVIYDGEILSFAGGPSERELTTEQTVRMVDKIYTNFKRRTDPIVSFRDGGRFIDNDMLHKDNTPVDKYLKEKPASLELSPLLNAGADAAKLEIADTKKIIAGNAAAGKETETAATKIAFNAGNTGKTGGMNARLAGAAGTTAIADNTATTANVATGSQLTIDSTAARLERAETTLALITDNTKDEPQFYLEYETADGKKAYDLADESALYNTHTGHKMEFVTAWKTVKGTIMAPTKIVVRESDETEKYAPGIGENIFVHRWAEVDSEAGEDEGVEWNRFKRVAREIGSNDYEYIVDSENAIDGLKTTTATKVLIRGCWETEKCIQLSEHVKLIEGEAGSCITFKVTSATKSNVFIEGQGETYAKNISVILDVYDESAYNGTGEGYGACAFRNFDGMKNCSVTTKGKKTGANGAITCYVTCNNLEDCTATILSPLMPTAEIEETGWVSENDEDAMDGRSDIAAFGDCNYLTNCNAYIYSDLETVPSKTYINGYVFCNYLTNCKVDYAGRHKWVTGMIICTHLTNCSVRLISMDRFYPGIKCYRKCSDIYNSTGYIDCSIGAKARVYEKCSGLYNCRAETKGGSFKLVDGQVQINEEYLHSQPNNPTAANYGECFKLLNCDSYITNDYIVAGYLKCNGVNYCKSTSSGILPYNTHFILSCININTDSDYNYLCDDTEAGGWNQSVSNNLIRKIL